MIVIIHPHSLIPKQGGGGGGALDIMRSLGVRLPALPFDISKEGQIEEVK